MCELHPQKHETCAGDTTEDMKLELVIDVIDEDKRDTNAASVNLMVCNVSE